MNQNLKLGFSTCPNDTFMFDAMVNHRIDTEGLHFDLELADIARLNQLALESDIDIIKVSYASYPLLSNKYQILESGSALGFGNGPLLVSKNEYSYNEVSKLRIGIPGVNTTANFLLSAAFPNAKHKTEFIFSDIEDAILNDKIDAGLLIHENRFTYSDRGLRKIIDLGSWWEQSYQLPIPLGGIMVKRSLPEQTKQTINKILNRSVLYAFDHPEASSEFVCQHAQAMNREVMQKHIKLYVNEFSAELGTKGREAVERLLSLAQLNNEISKITQPIFAI